jgi:hypothetical protein
VSWPTSGGVQVNNMRRRIRWLLAEGTMWMAVVVGHVLAEDCRQMTLADDEQRVGALPADGAHPTLRERVRPGRLRRSLDHVDAFGGEHRVERGSELRVAVAQQEPQRSSALVEVHQQVPGLLGHPGAGRMRGHPDQVDPAGGDLHEEQHVDPPEEHGIDGEEIAGQHRVRLGGQKLRPGRPAAPRRRVDAGLVEDFHTVLAATR